MDGVNVLRIVILEHKETKEDLLAWTEIEKSMKVNA